MNKKAQAQVITTILLILLVLAAIVIVWQVVSTTIGKGSEQVESQSGCIGVNIEVTKSSTDTTNTVFIAKRTAQGGTFKNSDVIVLVDKERKTITTNYAIIPTANPLARPLDTVTITLTAAATTSVEVGIIGDGTTCPATGKVTI